MAWPSSRTSSRVASCAICGCAAPGLGGCAAPRSARISSRHALHGLVGVRGLGLDSAVLHPCLPSIARRAAAGSVSTMAR
eukprot:scaffold35402_cov69-Phaeocystis_antarctica.AAC.1